MANINNKVRHKSEYIFLQNMSLLSYMGHKILAVVLVIIGLGIIYVADYSSTSRTIIVIFGIIGILFWLAAAYFFNKKHH